MSEIIEVLTPDIVGKKVTCYINGTFINDAKIQYEAHGYYICQNIVEGFFLPERCLNRLGYKYVWLVEMEGIRMYTGRNSVTNLKLVEKKEIPDLQTSVNNTIQKAQSNSYYSKRQEESERLRMLQGVGWAERQHDFTISNGTIGEGDIDNSDAISTHSKPKKEEETTHLVETYTTPEYIDFNLKPITYTWKRY